MERQVIELRKHILVNLSDPFERFKFSSYSTELLTTLFEPNFVEVKNTIINYGRTNAINILNNLEVYGEFFGTGLELSIILLKYLKSILLNKDFYTNNEFDSKKLKDQVWDWQRFLQSTSKKNNYFFN